MGKSGDNRSLWFRHFKSVLRLFVRKPKFVYLGKNMEGQQAFFLSNHVGASAPLILELYGHHPFRFWGTYEMNSSLKEVYKYLSNTYFHQKKHMNLFLARCLSIVAAPVLYLFYRGLNLISTYPDARFRRTLRETLKTLRERQSIVIFPELSKNGYFDELKMFHAGFVLMAEKALKEGIDLPLYLAYYRKNEHRYIVDKPVMISELLRNNEPRKRIADRLCRRCNELGKMKLESA
jgi:1-acyl-sn-glycerol-3-phosphate acyltransferase